MQAEKGRYTEANRDKALLQPLAAKSCLDKILIQMRKTEDKNITQYLWTNQWLQTLSLRLMCNEENKSNVFQQSAIVLLCLS